MMRGHENHPTRTSLTILPKSFRTRRTAKLLQRQPPEHLDVAD
jgi:hypothetical protein